MRLEIKRKGSASQYYYNCFFAGSGSPWILALLPHRSKKPGKLGFDVFFFFHYNCIHFAVSRSPNFYAFFSAGMFYYANGQGYYQMQREAW